MKGRVDGSDEREFERGFMVRAKGATPCVPPRHVRFLLNALSQPTGRPPAQPGWPEVSTMSAGREATKPSRPIWNSTLRSRRAS